MPTKKRFLIYFFGFSIGCFFVYFSLFKGKDRMYWLPGNRVKEQLMQKKLFFPENTLCKMKCRDINEEGVKDILKNGSVNFQESDIHDAPCPSYAIEGEISGNKKVRIIFTSFDSVTEVTTAINLSGRNDSCSCK